MDANKFYSFKEFMTIKPDAVRVKFEDVKCSRMFVLSTGNSKFYYTKIDSDTVKKLKSLHGVSVNCFKIPFNPAGKIEELWIEKETHVYLI